MTDEFNKLYDNLYRENISELEKYRQGVKSGILKVLLLIAIGVLIFIFIPDNIRIIATIIFIFVLFIFSFISIIGMVTKKKNINEENKYNMVSYKAFFKQQIVTPLIKSIQGIIEYTPYKGIEEVDYRKSNFGNYYDRYNSEDQISILLLDDENKKSNYLTLGEVLTERKSTDKDGHTSYYTVFHGLMGYVDVGKKSESYINIKQNFAFASWNKNKLNMDMSEFEKYFDVETDNKIEAMQILTSDIMTELIDFITTSKIKPEINIISNRMYIRFATGPMFEPRVFGNSMEKELLWRYYSITKFCINLSIKMSKVVNEAGI